MINIDARPNIEQLSRAFSTLERKQLPFAFALASTRLAKRVHAAERAGVRKDIENPINATLSSLFVRPATKRKPEARVWFKDQWTSGIPADAYMRTSVFGGQRKHKRFEKALIARGLMAKNQYAIPRPAVLDSHGNVKGSQVQRILSGLGAAETIAGYQANATDSRRSRAKNNKRFFVAKIGKAHGVWERKQTAFGSGVMLWFLFVDREPKYTRKFDFFGIADRVVREWYGHEFEAALDYAVRTAR